MYILTHMQRDHIQYVQKKKKLERKCDFGTDTSIYCHQMQLYDRIFLKPRKKKR